MRVLRWGLVGVGALLFVLLVAVRPGLGQTVPNFEDVPGAILRRMRSGGLLRKGLQLVWVTTCLGSAKR